jgi:hypothetical protein
MMVMMMMMMMMMLMMSFELFSTFADAKHVGIRLMPSPV